MELRKLLEGIEIKKLIGDPLQEIKGIAYHSRGGERFLFAAIRGLEFDGHQFIQEAIERGRRLFFWKKGGGSQPDDDFVPNSRQALAKLPQTFRKPILRSNSLALLERMEKQRPPIFWNRSSRRQDIQWSHRNDQLSVRTQGDGPPTPLRSL
jgi:UDP-N-acetylmuramyl pentapeptide synthase